MKITNIKNKVPFKNDPNYLIPSHFKLIHIQYVYASTTRVKTNAWGDEHDGSI